MPSAAHEQARRLANLQIQRAICGEEIIFTRAALQYHTGVLPSYPEASDKRRASASNAADAGSADNSAAHVAAVATLRPANSVLVTCIVDEDEGTYIHLGEQQSLYRVRPDFSLSASLPKISVVHAFAFVQDGLVRLGVFDASHFDGKDYRQLPAIQRHTALQTSMRPHDGVYVHWAGYQAVLDTMDLQLPFDVCDVMQLPSTLTAQQEQGSRQGKKRRDPQ